MCRVSVVTFVLALIMAGVSSSAQVAPVINISIYAPIQADSPVHIVGFHYDEGSLELALSNGSDKAVAGIAVVGLEVVPPGCAVEPGKLINVGGSVEAVPIDPHERVVQSRDNSHLPAALLVLEAKRLDAASLEFQVGVVEVDFADGTKWTRRPRYLYRTPFDTSLANADSGICSDAATITKALKIVDGVGFDRGIEKPSYKNDGGSAPPRLLFSCRLENSKAICPLS